MSMFRLSNDNGMIIGLRSRRGLYGGGNKGRQADGRGHARDR